MRCRYSEKDEPLKRMSTTGILIARKVFRKFFKDKKDILERMESEIQMELDRRKNESQR